MKFSIVLDAVPILTADPLVDPSEHQRVGLEGAEIMLVEFAGFNRDPLFGLVLDEAEILPGGNRKQQ